MEVSLMERLWGFSVWDLDQPLLEQSDSPVAERGHDRTAGPAATVAAISVSLLVVPHAITPARCQS